MPDDTREEISHGQIPEEGYAVTATDMHAEPREGLEEGDSASSVVERLRADGWQVSKLSAPHARRLFEPRKIDLEEFAFFNAELASAVKSGLPLPGALRALSRDMSGRSAREAVERVAAEVEGGADLAEALGRQGDAFPSGYVALVAAGLEAGDLAGTLLLFEAEARFAARLRHRFVAALLYPLLVLFAGSLLIAFVSRHVLPQFATLYGSLSPRGLSDLPAPTRFVLTLGPALKWAPLVVLALVVFGALAWQVVSRGAAISYALGRLMLALPLTGRLFRALAMARFCRTLAMALKGRMPVPGERNARRARDGQRLRPARGRPAPREDRRGRGNCRCPRDRRALPVDSSLDDPHRRAARRRRAGACRVRAARGTARPADRRDAPDLRRRGGDDVRRPHPRRGGFGVVHAHAQYWWGDVLMGLVLLLGVLVMIFTAAGLVCSPGPRAWSLAHFTAYVAATVRRNLPLGSSLSAYARDLPPRRFGKRKALFMIADAVDNGSSFADALDGRAAVFPGWYRALVRAGERGGNLAPVLDRLNETAELDSRDAQQLAGQALYPAALAGLATVMIVVVMGKFSAILANMAVPGAQVSFARTAAAGQTLAYAAFAIMTALIIVSFGSMGRARALGRRFPALARGWSWLAWHVPVVSRFARRRAVSQWALAAGELMDAGLPTHEALATAASSSGNLHFDSMMRRAAAALAEGMPLSEALRNADPRHEVPPEVAWYVETGERSGRLSEALARVSQSAAARSRSSLGHLVTLVLPLGILLVALSVGTQTYAIFGAVNACNEGVRNQTYLRAEPGPASPRSRKRRRPKQRARKRPPRRSGGSVR